MLRSASLLGAQALQLLAAPPAEGLLAAYLGAVERVGAAVEVLAAVGAVLLIDGDHKYPGSGSQSWTAKW